MSKLLMSRIANCIKEPSRIILYLTRKGMLHWMSDSMYLKVKYYARMHKPLNLKNPKTFNEKLNWLKIHDRRPEYTVMVDKYEVQKYIAMKLGEEYLIPSFGVWDDVDDIDIDLLPDQFVLKCTHNSGSTIVCKEKEKFDWDAAKRELAWFLKRNFYKYTREWPYKNVKPRIIAQKYLVDSTGYELRDYKFMCFSGEPKCLFVCLNRYTTGLNVDFYDMDWKPMPFERHYPSSGVAIDKPESFDLMVHFSRILSKDIPFVRVDFYEVNGHPYFGELTFYPGAGMEEFTPEIYDEILGGWLQLPEKR